MSNNSQLENQCYGVIMHSVVTMAHDTGCVAYLKVADVVNLKTPYHKKKVVPLWVLSVN